MQLIQEVEPSFYNAAKKYFSYKNRIKNEYIRVYGKGTLEEITATHEFNTIVNNGNVTNNYPDSKEGRMARKLNEKHKLFLNEAWLYTKKYHIYDFISLFNLLERHFST